MIRSIHHPSGAIAQLGERIVRNDEVVGSIPTSSTKCFQFVSSRSPHFQHSKNSEFIGTTMGQDFQQIVSRTGITFLARAVVTPARFVRRYPSWSRFLNAASAPAPTSGRLPLEPAKLRARSASNASSQMAALCPAPPGG